MSEATAPPVAPQSGSLVKPGRQRKLLTVALMLSMGVAAVEGTVVITALPTIVGELEGLTLYPWVFSVYLLTSTTTVPIYGKLADVYGRRPVFVAGIALFLLGTLLCGLAGSMTNLIAFRAVQGIGAGAVLPLTFTVLADIYTLQERARLQALFSSVWGVLSLVGPAFGAFIIATLSWRWVFFATLPVCVFAIALIWSTLRERVQRRQVAIDYAGAFTLTAGLVALLLAVLEGGHAFAWGSWQLLGLLALSAALLVGFVLVERRAADPMIPFRAFRIPIVAVSSVGNLLMGVVMFGLLSYVPLFAQGVRGESAGGASAVLTPMLLGWAGAASVSGRLYVAVGFRRAALIGTGLILLGTLPLMLITPESPLLYASVAMGLAGLGFGVTSPAFLLAPQSAVPWNLRGVVTSSTQFFRTIGGSIGVALMGALLTARLVEAASAASAGGDADSLINKLLNVQQRAQIPTEQLASLTTAMAGGLHVIFLVLAGVAVVGLLQVVLFAATPRDTESEPAEPKLERVSQQV